MIKPIQVQEPEEYNEPMKNIKELAKRNFVSRRSLPDIYGNADTYDDYMETAINEGYDSEEADVIYHELEHKYSN